MLKTAMKSTSLEVYNKYADSRNRREKEVLEVIRKLGPISNGQIAKYLGWDACRVTGRTNALVDSGLVWQRGYTKNDFGNSVITWMAQRKATQ